MQIRSYLYSIMITFTPVVGFVISGMGLIYGKYSDYPMNIIYIISSVAVLLASYYLYYVLWHELYYTIPDDVSRSKGE